MGYKPRDSGGGGGTPGLPVWTFAAADNSDPSSGEFTTDNAVINATNSIKISDTQKNGGGNWNPLLGTGSNGPPDAGAYIYLTDSSGKTSVFAISGSTGGAGNTPLAVSLAVMDATDWAGDYAVTFVPRNPPTPALSTILAASGIPPVADGTTTPVTSVTTQTGIVTALS